MTFKRWAINYPQVRQNEKIHQQRTWRGLTSKSLYLDASFLGFLLSYTSLHIQRVILSIQYYTNTGNIFIRILYLWKTRNGIPVSQIYWNRFLRHKNLSLHQYIIYFNGRMEPHMLDNYIHTCLCLNSIMWVSAFLLLISMPCRYCFPQYGLTD